MRTRVAIGGSDLQDVGTPPGRVPARVGGRDPIPSRQVLNFMQEEWQEVIDPLTRSA